MSVKQQETEVVLIRLTQEELTILLDALSDEVENCVTEDVCEKQRLLGQLQEYSCHKGRW